MKKLTEAEFNAMRLKPAGKTSYARNMLFNMQPGEIILLEKQDWTQKRPPTQLINRLNKKTGRKYSLLKSLDKPGWVVVREK